MPLKIIRRPGSSVWQITGTIAGQRVRESTGISDRALAEERRSQREQELYHSAIYGRRVVVTWEDAVISYSKFTTPSPGTVKFLVRLTNHFGGMKLKDIDQEAVDRAISALCKANAKPATKSRTVVIPVTAVLNHAFRRKWCDKPTFEAIPGAWKNKRTRWLTPGEVIDFLQAADPHLRPLILFLVCTGARLGEALSLHWPEVNLAEGTALLLGVKAKHGEVRDRLLRLTPTTIAMLTSLTYAKPYGQPGEVEHRRRGGLFRKSSGAEYVVKKDNNNAQVLYAWDRAIKRAGLSEDITPHILRHTWATWHYAIYRDAMKLKEEGDWSSLLLVERYTKIAPEGIVAEARAIWGLNPGKNLANTATASS
jgi:integrase